MVFVALMASISAFVFVDVLMKKAVDNGAWIYFAAGMLMSCVANLLYLPIIKNGLASGFLITTTLMTLGVLVAGVLHFNETLNAPQWTACGLLILATVFLALPENLSFSL